MAQNQLVNAIKACNLNITQTHNRLANSERIRMATRCITHHHRVTGAWLITVQHTSCPSVRRSEDANVTKYNSNNNELKMSEMD